MDGFSVFLLVVVGAVAVGLALRQQSAWKETLRRVAGRHGLRVEEGTWLRKGRAIGVHNGRRIEVDSFTRGAGKSSTTYTRVQARAALPAGLRLTSEGFGSAFKKMLAGDDVQVGDPWFDRAVVVEGGEAELLARLGAETRALVYRAIEAGAEVEEGTVTLVERGLVTDVHALSGMVETVMAVTKALSGEGDVNMALARHVADDPQPGFRRRCLELLAARDPRAAAGAAETALDDPDPELRLQAARLLGEEGREAARAMVVEPAVSTEVRVAAIDWLNTEGDAALADALQVVIERDDEPRVVAAALYAVAEARRTLPLETLRRHAESTAADVRRLVCACAPEGAEDFLLELLADGEDAVAAMAAERLAKVGTVRAVHPLQQRADGLFKSNELKVAARGAVAAIQRRIGDADAGRLSVVEARRGGALSVTED